MAILPILWASGASGLASEVPAGTDVEVRLLGPTGSRISHSGDRVHAVVISPVVESGVVTIPQGSLLSGSVTSVHRLGFGWRHCTASLELRFDSLQISRQAPLPVSARVLEVETAKEHVTRSGVIGGIHPAINASSGLSIFVSALLLQPAVFVPTLGIKFLLVRSPDPEIYFPAGTEMVVQLKRPATLPVAFTHAQLHSSFLPGLSSADEAEARRVLRAMPEQQTERKVDTPSDVVNLMFLGAHDQIDRAFHAAGWTGAQAHNAIAVYRMFYCVISRAGYTRAPMTHLRLNGVPEQEGYQKSLDTFAKRHHIRFWKQPESNAWLSAATEDLSFTVNHMLVTHASDRNIDNERAKVVNDLALTGCIDAASILPRTNLHIESDAARPIATDGNIAVLQLNDCRHPANVIPLERRAVTSRMRHVGSIVARDILRSNPLSLSLNATNMILNHEDARDPRPAALQTMTRQQRKDLAAEALLSNHWKRPSVIDNPVSLASGFTESSGR